MTGSVHSAPNSVAGVSPEFAAVLFVHATGFCKETLFPVADELKSSVDHLGAMFMDQRGHGESTPHSGPFDWNSLSLDVLDVLRGADAPLVGIGHSSGGTAIARAEILEPGTFAHLILIEPIVFPPPYEARDYALSMGAERRRRSFESRAAVWNRFHDGPFGGWDPVALDLYVDHGFHETAEGWTLRCEPSTEAEFYRQASNIDTWDRLREIRCPVTVMAGEYSTTHVDPFLELLLNQFEKPEKVVLSGLGHLSPMEDPATVATEVRAAMDRFSTLPTMP